MMRGEEKGSSEKNTVLRNKLENLLSDKILDVVSDFGELTVTLSEKEVKESFCYLETVKNFLLIH